MDIVCDTDGNQKKAVTKYDQEDDLMSDAASQVASSDHELAVDFTANTELAEESKREKTSELMKLLREKYSKYLPFIKGDLEFVEGKSASITLQFPLEYKKLLILQQAEAALKTVLIRN